MKFDKKTLDKLNEFSKKLTSQQETLKKELEFLNSSSLEKLHSINKELEKFKINNNFVNPFAKNKTEKILEELNIPIENLKERPLSDVPVKIIKNPTIENFKELVRINNELMSVQKNILLTQEKNLEFNNKILEQQIISNQDSKENSIYQKKINNILIFLSIVSILIALWTA